ncbi:MAG: WecB/TagA/CpsF family glycosyltransferase [Clostridia bacterium]|nr:WecB/TagA/CpsF family glycosyltransferase [Clostridia bacterium]
MLEKINILGVEVDNLDMAGALGKVLGFLDGDSPKAVFTPNSEIIMLAYKDEEFLKELNDAALIIPDGIGVVYASKILKAPLPERVAGYDLACNLIESLKDGKKSFYFFGGKPGVAETAKEKLLEKYPDLNICGLSDGYFDAEKEKAIIEDIKEKSPDVLFVCLGAPKQEKWINKHKDELGAKVLMGIGGSLDVFAGTVERAPEFFCNHGIEWLYRLIKQPSRFFRMLALPKFGLTVLFKGKRLK